MTRKVPYLYEEEIERDAAALLAEYERARGITVRPPIPIEDIVEKHLRLGLEFDDMHKRLGVPRSGRGLDPDILGAIFFDERRIVIDQSLDPEESPAREGRYRFTLAHEGGGHWRLHRHLFGKDPVQVSLFNEPTAPSVVCRSSQSKESIEWQADFYASCLLMPRKFVIAVWEEIFPDCKQRVLQPFAPQAHPYIEVERLQTEHGILDNPGADDYVLEAFAQPLAERFLVSPIAMRIRLEKLGLLLREVPRQRILAAG
jgi:Zn-dependent peptidase ImmA (M78 family)